MKMILIVWLIGSDANMTSYTAIFETPEACVTARKGAVESQKTSNYGSVEMHAICVPQQ